MKKQLLLGSALLAAISVYPQNGRIKPKPAGITQISKEVARKFVNEPETVNAPQLKQPIGPVTDSGAEAEKSSASLPPSSINWNLLTGSSNIYGMLLSESHPLQYNNELNAVSYIHRKSATYSVTPAIVAGAQSGVIVAMISSNGGASFDSTAVWSNGTDWGRYPQGGIYNPSGNTNIANAYVVACGPTVAGSNFSGNFYASKKLNAFNSTADANPGAQQQFPFAQTGSVTNHGWSRCSFSATDDGVMRSAALLQADNTTLAALRGYAIAKGTFNAGSFVWSTDSIIPPALIEPTSGDKVLGFAPQMAWNEAGTIGYFVTLGALNSSTSQNIGQHPIIYKTTNSGTSWSLLSEIDFNSTAMQPILDHLAPLNADPTKASPFFSDWDITVDKDNKLHIGALMFSHTSIHADSLNFLAQFENGPNGDLYRWGHTPGNRPYIYDFIGDGSAAWTFVTIDSASSEQADPRSGQPGFNDNPWDETGTAPAVKTNNVDHRIQLGRTPGGEYITFSWSESDTNFTNGQRKYNSLPNLKARCMAIGTGTNMYQVSPTEINVTKVAAGTGTANTSVSNRATMSYMSPVTGAPTTFTNVGTYTVDILTPMVVTNSSPYTQLANNATWYQNGKLSYAFTGTAVATGTTNSVHENSQNSASNSVIYPNPASDNAVIAIDMKENSNVDIIVMNAVGQVVKTSNAKAQMGQNKINIDLNGLSSGIYMVNVKVGNASSTKKLIVQ